MKGPITEEYILHLGKRKRLADVKSLDLSNHDLESLDVSLFNKLTGLEALDLSWNRLPSLPNNLRFSKLRVLDCSNNRLSSVDFVRQFGQLDELYIDDNEDLALDDEYIAKALCPKLRRLDTMSDLDHISRATKLLRDQLTPQIQAVWEAKYDELYSSGVDKSEIDTLHEEFTYAVDGAILKYNDDLPKFTQFMIRKISFETIEAVNIRKQNLEKSLKLRHGDTPNTPTSNSKHRTRVKTGITPLKDYSQGVPIDVNENCDNKKKTEVNNKKRKRDSMSSDSPVTKRKRINTPEKSSVKQTCDTSEMALIKKKEDFPIQQLPVIGEYDPIRFIRCHSQNNNPEDHDTKVWKCAFEPKTGRTGETTEIVATCGGRIVCLIDCHTSNVVKRYKDNSDTESFYCLAWTTLQADGDKLNEDANVLAVAGQDGVIKLIYPKQLVKYAVLEGHKDYVSALVFHPTNSSRLFSAARDGRIIQWDIGVPDFKDYKTRKWSRLSSMSLNKTDAISMVVCPKLNILLAGCEKSCFGWKLDDSKDKKTEVMPDYEFVHPKCSGDSNEVKTVDSLSVLSNNIIVSKCVGSNSLYLWNIESHVDGKRKLQNRTVRIPLTVLHQLDYVSVDIDYLYTTACKDILAVGDDTGNVHMYNLKQIVQTKQTAQSRLLLASDIVLYPERSVNPKFKDVMKDVTDDEDVVMNCVALSSNQEYLVCGTDNNLICLWRKSSQ